jgi:hypothetical protein
MVSSNKALLNAEQDGIGRVLTLPTFDMIKHFISVALPLGHDEAFDEKFRWIFWWANMVLVGCLPYFSSIHTCNESSTTTAYLFR